MKRRAAPDGAREVAEAVISDRDVVWFPIRHYSPRAAVLLADLLRTLKPAAVLVEAPDDATTHVEALAHPDTVFPVALVSAYEDRKNRFGCNGVLTPDAQTPARFRSWFPVIDGTPEAVAFRVGTEVGALVRCIDASLLAMIPTDFFPRNRSVAAVGDGGLAEGAWLEAVRRKAGAPSFDAFWQRAFEAVPRQLDEWRRDVLAFAWCVRHDGDPARFDVDGTTIREAHMRFHVDAVRKRVSGPVVVVVGALHAVALPFLKGRKARFKPDVTARTMLGPFSFRALQRLYDMEPRPVWTARVADALALGGDAGDAADRLVVEITRAARARGQVASTADAVAGAVAVRRLAAQRGSVSPTVYDLRDGVAMALVKGDAGSASGPIDAAIEDVLVGRTIGRVWEGAGRPALLQDFATQLRAFRLDTSGAPKTVRCETGRRPEHRERSAFLHQCRRADLPVFADVHPVWRGPDVGTGRDLHLLGETWAWTYREEVDATLLELSDRGDTLQAVASDLVRDDAMAVVGDAAGLAVVLLDAARMRLMDRLTDLLNAVREAALTETDVVRLVATLSTLTALHDHHDALPTLGDGRLAGVVEVIYRRAVIRVPSLATVDDLAVGLAMKAVHELTRFALCFDGRPLAREPLVAGLTVLADDLGARPGIRGVALGGLFGLGAARERRVVQALQGLIAGPTPSDAGPFLEGLFLSARGLLLQGSVLLCAVDEALGSLSWEAFTALLPDLRRAFTAFTPSEIHAIGGRVAVEVGETEPVADPFDVDVAAIDRAAGEAMARWGL